MSEWIEINPCLGKKKSELGNSPVDWQIDKQSLSAREKLTKGCYKDSQGHFS
jgi:hypothetical protein